jgi:hypothetical protein
MHRCVRYVDVRRGAVLFRGDDTSMEQGLGLAPVRARRLRDYASSVPCGVSVSASPTLPTPPHSLLTRQTLHRSTDLPPPFRCLLLALSPEPEPGESLAHSLPNPAGEERRVGRLGRGPLKWDFGHSLGCRVGVGGLRGLTFLRDHVPCGGGHAGLRGAIPRVSQVVGDGQIL